VDFNFFSADVIQDPFPYYEQMRSQARAIQNDNLGFWMVHRHGDASRVLKDHQVFSSSAMGIGLGRVGALMSAQTMSSADPPEQGRLRNVFQRTFTPRAVAELEASVRDHVQSILAPLRDGDVFDVVNDYTAAMSISLMARLIGISTDDLDSFQKWSRQLEAGNNPFCSSEDLEIAEVAAQSMLDYFRRELEARRRIGTDADLMGRLIAANEDESLSEDELVASLIFLLFAGYETTSKLVGNSVLCLATRPAERQWLVDNPDRIDAAVEEFLRLVGPVQGWLRLTQQAADFGDSTIPPGQIVVALAGAANRDPEVFPNPDRLDLTRSPNPHLSFSHGAHYCLGAALARIESRIALNAFLKASPRYELADPDEPPAYSNSFFLRGLTRLKVVIGT
jgi:cytochrome P450